MHNKLVKVLLTCFTLESESCESLSDSEPLRLLIVFFPHTILYFGFLKHIGEKNFIRKSPTLVLGIFLQVTNTHYKNVDHKKSVDGYTQAVITYVCQLPNFPEHSWIQKFLNMKQTNTTTIVS